LGEEKPKSHFYVFFNRKPISEKIIVIPHTQALPCWRRCASDASVLPGPKFSAFFLAQVMRHFPPQQRGETSGAKPFSIISYENCVEQSDFKTFHSCNYIQ
jgi:hypothetical protein